MTARTKPQQVLAELLYLKGYSFPMLADAAGYDRGLLYRWRKGAPARMDAIADICALTGLEVKLVGVVPDPPRYLAAASLGRPPGAVSRKRKAVRLAGLAKRTKKGARSPLECEEMVFVF